MCIVHTKPSKPDKTGPESFIFRQTISIPGSGTQKKGIGDDSFDCPHTFFVSGIESGWWQELAETKPP